MWGSTASCSVEVWVVHSGIRSVLYKLTKYNYQCLMSLLTLQKSQPGAGEEKWAKGFISMAINSLMSLTYPLFL